MIEKIGTKGYESISKPAKEVIELIDELKKSESNITVAEIGVGIGTTSVEILKHLSVDDKFYLFSYEDDVEELINDLEKLNNQNIIIIGQGNTRRTYDSYNWNLAKIALTMKNEKLDGIFDIVYLDGSHTFMHDATACCCIKKLLKIGGYVIFDDMYWSFAKSPTVNPQKRPDILNLYNEEQIEACQIDMVVSLFMKDDDKFQQIFLSDVRKPSRTIWKRIN